MDLCMYGARDPGNMLAHKKPMSLASDVDLTVLIRTCNRTHVHQVVEGSVRSGARKGTRRSNMSGEYQIQLCKNNGRIGCIQH